VARARQWLGWGRSRPCTEFAGHDDEPMSTSKKFVQQTMDEMTGLIENAALDTRVAWVRDLLDRVTVDGREEHAVAIWRTATDDGVNRSDSVSSWLRR